MVETNIVLSIKSTYPVSSCILCHLPAFQADSKLAEIASNRLEKLVNDKEYKKKQGKLTLLTKQC